MALSFSTDGLQLFKVGTDSVWPLLLVNLNLNPKNVSKSTISCSAVSFPVPITQETFTRSSDPLSTNSRHSQPELKMSTTPTLRKHLLCDHTSFFSPLTCLQLQRRWGYLGMVPITIVDFV